MADERLPDAGRNVADHALRSLQRISSMAARWDGCAPDRIAEDLARVLSEQLAPAAVRVRVPLGFGKFHEITHEHDLQQAGHAIDVAGTLLPRLDQAGPAATVDLIETGGAWRVALQWFGANNDSGGLIICVPRPAFPTPHEQLVLDAAVGHASCMLRTKHGERSLLHQRRQLETALDIIGDAVICTDAEGRVEAMNRIAVELTGSSVDEARGLPAREIFELQDDHGAPIECPIDAALSQRQLVAIARPVVLIDHDGIRHPVEHRASPIQDEDTGQPVGAVFAFRDIADRQRADALRERLLRQAESQSQRQLQAFHLAPSFMALLRGPQHVFELVNARYYELIGKRDVIGKPVRVALPELDGKPALQLLEDAYRSGEPVSDDCVRVQLAREAGKPLEERLLDIAIQPLREQDGSVSGVLVHGIDRTEQRRAEARLRERDSRLQLFLDNATDYAEVITDRDGHIVEWLGGAEHITGWSAEEMIGQRTDPIFTDEDRAMGRPQIEMIEAARSGRAEDRRWHVRKDGARFFADGVLVSLRDPDGELRGYGKLFRDATAQKKSADELAWITAESERRRRLYEAALSNTPDLVYVLDLDHRFVYANEALLRVWGRGWSEAIGKNYEELGYPARQAATHNREIEQVIRTGQPVRGEVPFNGPHGCRIHDYILVPVLSVSGEVEAVAGTTRDVTDHKRSEQRFAQVAQASQRINATLAVDAICQVAAEQARAIIGARKAVVSLSVDDDCGQSVQASAGPTSAEDSVAPGPGPLVDDVCRNQRPRRITGHLPAPGQPRRDGEPVSRNGWIAAPMTGHGDRTLGLIHVLDKAHGEFTEEDESILTQIAAVAAIGLENAELYDSLRQADQRKDEFLATLAHELRNPLAPIRYAIELMRNSGDSDIRNEAREMASRQVSQLVRLVDDLLDVARISTGKLQVRRQPVDLRDVVRGAVETSRPTIEQAGQQLQVQLPDEPVVLEADPARLAQVLLNLLNNAAKYSEPGGTIRLSASREGEQLVLRVSDTGIGIPPESLPAIFDLFSQVDNGSERGQGGLGIGLTLVKRLVELHGGQIEAHSPGRQRGSEFVIRLPLPARPRPVPEPTSTNGSKEQPARPRRVLVVDDNRDAANSLGFLLDALGHKSRIAYDGAGALAEAGAFEPDVAILDIGMPGMDGFELAQRLRRMPGRERTTLIALTGWGQEPDRKRSREAGFDHHLVKPADLTELKRLVAGQK